jgi:hypothetical protein
MISWQSRIIGRKGAFFDLINCIGFQELPEGIRREDNNHRRGRSYADGL